MNFDFKFPLLTFPWLVGNLFFVVIPEEVFFRGFLQRQITKAIQNKAGPYLAKLFSVYRVCSSALLFVQNFMFIIFAFVASIIYGLIYQFTKAIESSIFCHYALNVVHFIFFTYPILSSATT